MDAGVMLSLKVLSTFSPSTREEVIDYLKTQAGIPQSTPQEVVHSQLPEEGPDDLSFSQMQKFLERCSPKTQKALRVIAKADLDGFTMDEIVAAYPEEGDDLRSVWGGLTKRVRTVLGKSDAWLIWWTTDESNQWRGRVSAITHKSLRQAFGM